MREWVIFNLDYCYRLLIKWDLIWYIAHFVLIQHNRCFFGSVLYIEEAVWFGMFCKLCLVSCCIYLQPMAFPELGIRGFGVAHPRPPWLWHRPHLLEASHKSPAWYHTTSSHILCHLFCDIDQFFTLVLTSVWLNGERRENILEMFSRNEKLTQLQKIYLGRISRKSVGGGWAAVGAGREEIPTITGTAC